MIFVTSTPETPSLQGIGNKKCNVIFLKTSRVFVFFSARGPRLRVFKNRDLFLYPHRWLFSLVYKDSKIKNSLIKILQGNLKKRVIDIFSVYVIAFSFPRRAEDSRFMIFITIFNIAFFLKIII